MPVSYCCAFGPVQSVELVLHASAVHPCAGGLQFVHMLFILALVLQSVCAHGSTVVCCIRFLAVHVHRARGPLAAGNLVSRVRSQLDPVCVKGATHAFGCFRD